MVIFDSFNSANITQERDNYGSVLLCTVDVPKVFCVTENRRPIDVFFSNYPPPSYFPVLCPRCRGVETNSPVKY